MLLEEIRRRAERMTPGPYKTGKYGKAGATLFSYALPDRRLIIGTIHPPKENIEFFAHAREDIFQLLAIIEIERENSTTLLRALEWYADVANYTGKMKPGFRFTFADLARETIAKFRGVR